MTELSTTEARKQYIHDTIEHRNIYARILCHERQNVRDILAGIPKGRFPQHMRNDIAKGNATARLRHDHHLISAGVTATPVGTPQRRARLVRQILTWTEDYERHQQAMQGMYCGDDDAYLDNVDHWRRLAIACLEYDGLDVESTLEQHDPTNKEATSA